MTAPTSPSEMPRGTLLVKPGDDPADTGATRMLKTAYHDWVQVSGQYSAGIGGLKFYSTHADYFLADWQPQSLADWQAATGMS